MTKSHTIFQEMMSQEQMKNIPTSEGKKIGDLVALAIGSVGENMSLARGTRLVGGPGVQLIGYSHPSTIDDDVLVGKFGAILALRSSGELTEAARQLCVHIVGMYLFTYLCCSTFLSLSLLFLVVSSLLNSMVEWEKKMQ